MAMTKKQIISEAMSLDPRDREAIAEELLLSVDSATQEEVSDAWAAEIQRRVARADRGEGSSKPVDKIVARLRNKAKQ
jgi:putative addiction module component (TIGR02574 family)